MPNESSPLISPTAVIIIPISVAIIFYAIAATTQHVDRINDLAVIIALDSFNSCRLGLIIQI